MNVWLYILGICALLMLLQYMWHRRRFYYLSLKMHGPFPWPFIGNALEFIDSSKVISNLDKISKKYRTPFRFWLGGRFIVMFNRPEEIETIMTSQDCIDKGEVYEFVKDMIGGHGLFTIRGEEWKIRRKLLNPTIQNYNFLNNSYPYFNKSMRILVDELETKVGKGPIDIYHSLEACTLDMICESWVNYSRLCKNVILFLIIDKKIDEFKNANLTENTENQSRTSDEFRKKRSNIFIDECVRLSIEQQCFTESDLITEALTMMAGGFETTALTASYITLMLALHPELQEKVFQEIHDIFPEQSSDVSADDIAKLDYTDRFIKETMRYTPTVPLLTRYANKDIQIGKYHIPKGTELIMSVFNLHRNPLVWGDSAGVFDPDHFLPEEYKEKHPYSYVPFSAGQRNCIGLKYGNIVIRQFVCWLVRNYRFTTDLKIEQLRFRMNVTMKLQDNHMVHVHKRENY